MRFTVEAACGCHTGNLRKQNEDNFFFDGKCLEQEHSGLEEPAYVERATKSGMIVAVFDGMGGERFGAQASFAAARQMQQTERMLSDFFIPERSYLERLTEQMNQAVLCAQMEKCTQQMGTTMAGLYFSGRYVYVCNVGDSRAYRLRDGELLQLSVDHVAKRPGSAGQKAPLTRYLGIDPEEVQLEPYIAKDDLRNRDMYLLCSDGLTDMLTNMEIAGIMLHSSDAESCVRRLQAAALEHGGQDNITMIVCKVKSERRVCL